MSVLVVFVIAISRANGLMSVPIAFIPTRFASTNEVPVPAIRVKKNSCFVAVVLDDSPCNLWNHHRRVWVKTVGEFFRVRFSEVPTFVNGFGCPLYEVAILNLWFTDNSNSGTFFSSLQFYLQSLL